MTKEEFKEKWESDENGGGITFNQIADCAVKWGIAQKPRILPIDYVRYMVLKAADTNDYHEYALDNENCNET